MNGNWNEVKVKVTVEVGAYSPVSIERTVRYFDKESFDREMDDLYRSAGRLAEHTARQEAVVQVR